MAEQRLIDATDLIARGNASSGGVSDAVLLKKFVDAQPTIDPETLPIVRQLREELAKVAAQRDAAVNDLLHAGQGNDFCLYCVHCCVNGNTKYRPHETYMEFCKKCDDDYSQFEWRGLQKEG